MMKKIISCIIALAMMLTIVGVSAGATAISSINAYYDAENYEITVSGTFPAIHGAITVIVSRYNESTLDSYDDITEVNIGTNVIQMARWNGNGSLTLRVPSTTTAGYYIVFCGGQGLGGVASDVFYITDINEQNAAITAFKTATADTVGAAITTYAVEKPLVNLDLTNAAYVANTQDVHKAFVNCIAEKVAATDGGNITLGDISDCFDKAIALVAFNNATDKAAALDTYGTLLEISTSADSTAHKAAAADLILLQSEAVEGKIFSQADFIKAFNKAVAICVVNSSTRDTVKGNLFAYDDVLGFDAESGYATADESKLNALMAFGSYTKAEDIKTAFETAVIENPKPTTQGGGGSLGGGGGSGGGITGSASNSQTTVARPPVSAEEDKTPMESEGVFADIAEYNWAKDAISYLNKSGVLQGVGDGKFEPARNIKREEIAKILVEAFDLSDKGQAVEFADVDKSAWHYNYVNVAYQHGLVNGIGAESFGTGSFVTRQDAAVMIYRYLKSTGYEFTMNGDDFADANDCAEYAKEAIKALKNSGLVSGNGDNTFNPNDSLTRAQAAVMIYNIISEMEAK